ncbi:extracellular solute-binding protein [Phycicoccus endophyticus]|uniref:Extracellular solute-binding protein n=1 Tax=Phycicoccus endophyticus TaxID=1690220 RepID=A0A7G9R203_9MICO|nr:extracellular solute-binding protein [Phycicoccus endophyticus]NHI19740.1 extracellular solute-binding protein [Phycicoccus endophyticus]QNN49628.1 extracellular solute-binding protein [Phycicoccus endophyticus]GGL33457.1 sugar ABC transporter substrate-binding protein [Phycicoccus endophyticus]
MRSTRRLRTGVVAVTVLGLSGFLAACGGDSEAGDNSGDTFTIVQYEDPTTAQGQGWAKAVEIFKEDHPDVTVDFQQTSFDAVRQNAKILLAGNDVPDVIEFNKGNADGGQLAAQGLLEPLTDEVSERGWDEKVTGPMAAFARYDENGNAGEGEWYGIPNFGEYVMFYYNKDVFEKAGITEIPTDLDGFEAMMDKLLAQGVTPISSSASTSQGFNQMWVWYSLVSALADRDQIDDFMFLRDDVDFSADPWAEGTETFAQWIDKGYVGKNLGGLSYEQATVNFLRGNTAMLIWNNGEFARITKDASFDWGTFTMPGANLVMGSSGHLWGVPAKSDNKDLAYDWIETTLSPEVQNVIGKNGGLPLAGDPSQIDDERVRALSERFNELVDQDAISYYPDYPVPGFLDFIQSNMQAMSNQNENASEYLEKLQAFYDEGKESQVP